MFNNPKPKAVYNASGAAAAIATTGYTEIATSTSAPASAMQICNTTGSLIKIAIGAAASEEDIPFYVPTGEVSPIIPIEIAKASRISARAVDANSSGGQLVVNLLG